MFRSPYFCVQALDKNQTSLTVYFEKYILQTTPICVQNKPPQPQAHKNHLALDEYRFSHIQKTKVNCAFSNFNLRLQSLNLRFFLPHCGSIDISFEIIASFYVRGKKVACHTFPHVNFALFLMQQSQVDTFFAFLHLKVKRSKGFEIKRKQFYNAVAKGLSTDRLRRCWYYKGV